MTSSTLGKARTIFLESQVPESRLCVAFARVSESPPRWSSAARKSSTGEVRGRDGAALLDSTWYTRAPNPAIASRPAAIQSLPVRLPTSGASDIVRPPSPSFAGPSSPPADGSPAPPDAAARPGEATHLAGPSQDRLYTIPKRINTPDKGKPMAAADASLKGVTRLPPRRGTPIGLASLLGWPQLGNRARAATRGQPQ
ncbi:hypothetical protein [Singulisphaera sp. PoT]|uniref:hypothetical protein n=1 Tax=Singulisphaera sp. PoT TaxID=3411797 RepID=UPI003BF53A0D